MLAPSKDLETIFENAVISAAERHHEYVTLEHILREGSEITTINKTVCVNYGFYYRHKDAISTTFGFKIKGIRVGLAFDANISYLSRATNSIGAIEVYFKSMHLYKKSGSRGKMKKLS